MSLSIQRAVPIDAIRRAQAGDARGMLALPEFRDRVVDRYYSRYSSGRDILFYTLSGSIALDCGPLEQAAEDAKILLEARLQRRRDLRTATDTRIGQPGRFLALRERALGWKGRREIRYLLSQARPKVRTGRALLAIPEARSDIPRLIARKKAPARGDWETLATDWGTRAAIAEARTIVAERQARRAAREVATEARTGVWGRYAAMARERLGKRLAAAVTPIYREYYRKASCGRTTTVQIGEPSIRVDLTEGWKNYKSQGYRRGITDMDVTIRVPADWLRTVQARGLAEVDGLLTLAAEPLPSGADGFEVYRAAWVRQGRGLAAATERGLIVRHAASGTTYHHAGGAEDVKKAVAALRRKLTAQAIPVEVREQRTAERIARKAAAITRLVERVARFDIDEIRHVVVRREDSLRAGNCAPGTDAFIDRFFPDRSHDSSATVGEIADRVSRLNLASLRGVDLTLARQLAAAVLVAIRRDRNARRLMTI